MDPKVPKSTSMLIDSDNKDEKKDAKKSKEVCKQNHVDYKPFHVTAIRRTKAILSLRTWLMKSQPKLSRRIRYESGITIMCPSSWSSDCAFREWCVDLIQRNKTPYSPSFRRRLRRALQPNNVVERRKSRKKKTRMIRRSNVWKSVKFPCHFSISGVLTYLLAELHHRLWIQETIQ